MNIYASGVPLRFSRTNAFVNVKLGAKSIEFFYKFLGGKNIEFREFSNPEDRNYDINSSLNNDNYSFNSQSVQHDNKYYIQLFDLIGILEDFEESELKDIIFELIELDANYKVGLIDLNIGLESILCRYCSKWSIDSGVKPWPNGI